MSATTAAAASPGTAKMWTKIFKISKSSGKNSPPPPIVDKEVNKSKRFKGFSLKRGSSGSSSKESSSDAETPPVSDPIAEITSPLDAPLPLPLSPLLTTIPPPPPDGSLNLEKCPICARTFLPDSLAKHIGICERMSMRKRKVFDSSRQRIEGTELAAYNQTSPTHHHQHPAKTGSAESQERQVKISPPRSTPPTRKFEKTPSVERKVVSPAREPRPQVSSMKRITAEPQKEQCPFCERCFGFKAYDRHVEWCREKALLKQINNKETVSAAKERLQARIKYKAPSLKTKRQANREKYSGSLSASGSTSSLADLGTPYYRNKDYQRQSSMTQSMTSSMTSDSCLSDRYDPFLSAKRQLEELFSPTQSSTPTTNTTNHSTKPSLTATKSLMSTSLTSPSVTSKTPFSTKPATTPTSNFKRTSSLRISKKINKPLYSTPAKSNIQRGITDEGPISPNFVKAQEYDEIPVKGALTSPVPSVFSGSTGSRTPTPERHLLRSANSIAQRRNLTLSIQNPAAPAENSTFPVSKTDSLAAFLKYERELSHSPSMTEKDFKEKTNSLNKRSSQESKENIAENERLPEIKQNHQSPTVTSPLLPKVNSIKLEPIERKSLLRTPEPRFNRENSMKSPETKFSRENSLRSPGFQRDNSLKLSESRFNRENSLRSPEFQSDSSQKSSESRFNRENSLRSPDFQSEASQKSSESKFSRENSIKSPEFQREISPKTPESNFSRQSSLRSPEFQANRESSPRKRGVETPETLLFGSNRGSGGDQKILRRQMKLSKNSILYDTPSPVPDPYSEECDKKISQLEAERDVDTKSYTRRQLSTTDHELESLFGDFDFEEFISSFEDDENYPIFKNYKDILLSRTINASSNNLGRSDSGSSVTETEVKSGGESGQDPISESITMLAGVQENLSEVIKGEKYERRLREKQENGNGGFEDLSPTERELLKSVKELDQMCESGVYPADSDEFSSVEGFPLRKHAGSKMSADSAYGSSLSRHSPPERSLRRAKDVRMPEILQSNAKQRQQTRREQLSLSSSSGSESSLPPINSNLVGQKMELHPHKEKLQTQTSLSSGGESKLSKFCHECGSRFKIVTAKFCMECGAKRIVLD